jgi:hypothetical protein
MTLLITCVYTVAFKRGISLKVLLTKGTLGESPGLATGDKTLQASFNFNNQAREI